MEAESREGEAEESRLYGTDCQKKSADFSKRAKWFASVWSSAGLRFVEVEPVTVGRYSRKVTRVYSVMR